MAILSCDDGIYLTQIPSRCNRTNTIVPSITEKPIIINTVKKKEILLKSQPSSKFIPIMPVKTAPNPAHMEIIPKIVSAVSSLFRAMSS